MTSKLEKLILRTWSVTVLNDFFHLVAPSCSVKNAPVTPRRIGSVQNLKSWIPRPTQTGFLPEKSWGGGDKR